ncbi:MAG: hypothetical protein AAGA20_09200 [Planctomycetota bacterium]
MSLDPRVQGPGEPQLAGTQGAGQSQPASADPAAGAAFRALLERLEAKSRALGEASESVDDPHRLAAAVEDARTSVADAVSLGSDLLEAYRAAQQRAAAGSTTTQTDSGSTESRGMKR